MNPSASRIVDLLPEQRRFLTRGLPGAHHWNQAALYTIPPELTAEIATQAVRWVLARHEGLWLRLQGDSDATGTGLLHADIDEFEVFDVDLTSAMDASTLANYCADAQASLRLDHAPMLHVSRIAWRENTFRLLIIVHHFVTDGVGYNVIVSEFAAACRALVDGKVPQAPAVLGAHEYASWLRTLAHDPQIVAQRESWLKIAQPCPAVVLEKPGENTMSTTEIATAALTAEETAHLIRAASVRGRTSGLLETVIAALIPILGRDPYRMRTNMIGHGRHGLPNQPAVQRTVGWLSTRYPVTIDIPKDANLLTQRDCVAEQLMAVPTTGAGFGLLRFMNDDPATRQEMANLGDPDITVNYQGRTRPTDPQALLQPAPESAGPDETSTGLREHVHGVDLIVDNGKFTVVWFFSTNQFTTDTVTAYATELCDRLRTGLNL